MAKSRIRKFRESFLYAGRGLRLCITGERNFRVHMTAAFYVTAAAVMGHVTSTEAAVLCLCFGLGLDAEQTQKLLLHAGCAQLYIKKPRESIIFYALNAGLPLPSCNQLLYEHGEAILGWA